MGKWDRREVKHVGWGESTTDLPYGAPFYKDCRKQMRELNAELTKICRVERDVNVSHLKAKHHFVTSNVTTENGGDNIYPN